MGRFPHSKENQGNDLSLSDDPLKKKKSFNRSRLSEEKADQLTVDSTQF